MFNKDLEIALGMSNQRIFELEKTLIGLESTVTKWIANDIRAVKSEILEKVKELEKGFLLLQRFLCDTCGKSMTWVDDKHIISQDLNLLTNIIQHNFICGACYPAYKESRIKILQAEDANIPQSKE